MIFIEKDTALSEGELKEKLQMHILKKQTNIMVIIASTILILLGTYSKIFSLLAAVPILYLFMVLDEFSILCLLCYLMPFASIFKISPESQSFFTIFELLFCVMHFVKNNMKTNKINVFIILFGIYLVVIEILNGGINISATIKMVTNLLVLSFATSFNTEKGYRRLSLYYIYGIVISSIVGLFDSNIFHIRDYIGVTEQRIGDEFIMRFSGLYREKINSIQAMAFLVLVVFLGIVFESTVFTRTCSVRQYELFPFWSWIEIIWKHDWSLLKQVSLNCLLLLPVGVLLPVIAEHKVKWYWGLGVGVLISVTIEICQLILKRGLFEWDDILHNGLGCMVGCLVVNIFKKEKNRD